MNLLFLINGSTTWSLFIIQFFTLNAADHDVMDGISSTYPCASWHAAFIAVVSASVKNV